MPEGWTYIATVPFDNVPGAYTPTQALTYAHALKPPRPVFVYRPHDQHAAGLYSPRTSSEARRGSTSFRRVFIVSGVTAMVSARTVFLPTTTGGSADGARE